MSSNAEQLLFGPWTPAKAWVWGIFFGDGNAYTDVSNGNYRFSICGSLSTVTRCGDLLGIGHTLHLNGVSDRCYEIYLYNKQLVDRIHAEYGIRGPKSHDLQWPAIPAAFERDFLRGLWDSDGSVTIGERRYLGDLGNDSPAASFSSACRTFAIAVQDGLVRNLEISPNAIVESVKEERGKRFTQYGFSYCGRKAMCVTDWLYGDIPDNLVNEDRLQKYREQCALRDQLASALCPCGAKPSKQGLCGACWYTQRGRTTGSGTLCGFPGCSNSVLAKGLCCGCYTRGIRGGVAESQFIENWTKDKKSRQLAERAAKEEARAEARTLRAKTRKS